MNLSTRVLLGVCAFVCTVYGQSNETAVENTNPGTTSWQLTNPALNREIEGYASLTSVNAGSSISFFASTAAPSYTMDVYRLGWYGGTGGASNGSPLSRGPACLQTTPAADSFGRFECNWTNRYRPGDSSELGQRHLSRQIDRVHRASELYSVRGARGCARFGLSVSTQRYNRPGVQ